MKHVERVRGIEILVGKLKRMLANQAVMFLNLLFHRAINVINPISRGELWSKAKTRIIEKGPNGKILLQQGGIRRNAVTIAVVSFVVGPAGASEREFVGALDHFYPFRCSYMPWM
jgi:hypothetical protein